MRNNIVFPFVVSIFGAFLGVLWLFITFDTALGSDLVSFLTGAKILREGKGVLLYDHQTQLYYQQEITKPVKESWALPYHNIPVLALILIPLTYLPLLLAYKIFVLILIGIAALISYFVQKIFENIEFGNLWALLPLLYYQSIGSIFMGQISLLITLVLFWVFYLLREKKDNLAGVITSLLFLKFQYIIFFVYAIFLAGKKSQYIKGFLFGILLLLLTSTFLTKGSFITAYFPYVFSLQKPELGIRAKDMFTLHASLTQIFSISYIQAFFINLAIFTTSVIVFLTVRKKIYLGKAYAIGVILTLVFAVHGVSHDLSLLLVPIFILIDKLKSRLGINPKETVALFILLILAPALFVFEANLYIPFLLIISCLLLILPEKAFFKRNI